ncbi:hypothetical protein FEM48_Zijuj04G0067700 [Ziziphus jujuba var. spinosa]|uniref:Uncharacterized protein n=1 Tax=Ziziphus jujuba var. spinosa TaxID=714518 RepID=A0A978VIE4_ZIZJJ|nr:hypothetical protein FEM48_Zijuj04G0067700 [Ziziphus jujuba var. spinosa]
MAQEYLKEYIRLTRNENLEEPPSVNYYQNPNQYRLNVPPKITYEPHLVKAKTHRFQTTHEQPPPPPNINTGVVAPAVTRPYKPSPSPSLVVNGYEYQNDTIYDQEPPEQVIYMYIYMKTFRYIDL